MVLTTVVEYNYNTMDTEFNATINAYFDESRIDNPESNFMVFGGLFVDRKYVKNIRRDITLILREEEFHSEIKWVRTDKQREVVYKRIVDYFFDTPAAKLAFNCIVVDKSLIQLEKFHDGDKELAFYKFVYQLLKKRIKPSHRYYLMFDFKPNKVRERLADLKGFLDSFIYVEHANTAQIKHLQGYDSKENVMLQVADLFTGAVGYAYNTTVSRSSKPKADLTKYIASKLNEESLKLRSSPSEKKFNIFAIDLNKRG